MRDRLTCIFGPRLASRVLHKHARDPGPARPSKPQPKNPARLLSGDPGAARPSKPQPKNSARLLSGTQLYMYISTLDPSRSAPPCALDGSRKGAFGFQRLVLDPKARFPRLWSVQVVVVLRYRAWVLSPLVTRSHRGRWAWDNEREHAVYFLVP